MASHSGRGKTPDVVVVEGDCRLGEGATQTAGKSSPVLWQRSQVLLTFETGGPKADDFSFWRGFGGSGTRVLFSMGGLASTDRRITTLPSESVVGAKKSPTQEEKLKRSLAQLQNK